MSQYLVGRLIHAGSVVLGVTVVVFFLARLGGDPTALMAPLDATEEDMQILRSSLGFDRPLPVQYLDFLTNAATGDFGLSIRHRQPAMDLVLERLPATLQLTALTLIIALTIAIPLGIISATNPNSITDRLSVVIALGGQSIPTFLLGIVLIIVVSVQLRWLPSSGRGTFSHLILPSVTLGPFYAAMVNRLLRSSLREELGKDYIRTARSKGIGERYILVRHAMKNAAIPVVTVMGLQIGALISGSIVTETVFAYPGTGLLLVQALRSRDFPIIQAYVVLIAVIVVLINFSVDILYGYLDPRIRLK